jgi:hypothetical protein
VSNDRPNPLLKNVPWLQANLGFVAGIVFTAFLAIGTLLAILFLFLPLINAADVARAEAKIMAGDSRMARLRQDVENDIAGRGLDPAPAKARREERLEPEENKWKTEKAQLEIDLDALKASVRSKLYGYHWGMMIACIFLGFGSLGYLVFGQTVTVRIVGGVMLVLEVGLVLVKFLAISAALR